MNSRGKNKGVISTLRIAGTMYENVWMRNSTQRNIIGINSIFFRKQTSCVYYTYFSPKFSPPPPSSSKIINIYRPYLPLFGDKRMLIVQDPIPEVHFQYPTHTERYVL